MLVRRQFAGWVEKIQKAVRAIDYLPLAVASARNLSLGVCEGLATVVLPPDPLLLPLQHVLHRIRETLAVGRGLRDEREHALAVALDPARLLIGEDLAVGLELDGGLEILEQDQELDKDEAAEVGVAQLQLQQVLVGQVFGEVLLWRRGGRRLHRVLLCDILSSLSGLRIELETLERVENLVGVLLGGRLIDYNDKTQA